MTATPHVYPTREEWLAAKRNFVGASEAAAVCGLDPYRSAYSLWATKVGLVVDSGAEVSEAAFWGNVLEPVIAERYSQETGFALLDHGRTTVMRGEHPILTATLDREILAPGHPGALEIKAPGFLQRDKWEAGPPERYVLQLQAQLSVTGWSWGAIACLIGGQDFRIYRLERDQELIALILEQVDSFWRCVRDQVPPEPDGSASTARTLKILYPEDSGVEVMLDPGMEHWARVLQVARAEEKRHAATAAQAENHLRLAIGTATYARVGEFYVSAKTTKRAGYTVEPTTFRALKFTDAKITKRNP